jgi:hypothetical protein
MADFTGIDAPAVSAIGDTVLDVAGHLDRLSGEVDRCRTAPDPVEGSAALGALGNFTVGWRDTLTGLAEQVRGFGDDLHRAAGDYRRTDADAADEMWRSGVPRGF